METNDLLKPMIELAAAIRHAEWALSPTSARLNEALDNAEVAIDAEVKKETDDIRR